MTDQGAGSSAIFEEFRRKGRAAVEQGQLEKAAELYLAALDWTRSQEDAQLVDLALCSWTSVAIELGKIEDGSLASLREILLRSDDSESCYLAAYNLSRFYEVGKNPKKALFYARIARERAEAIGSRERIASVRNMMGNLLLAEGGVDEACKEFEEALRLLPLQPSVRRAQILDNLGYSYSLMGRHKEGFSLLFQSLRILRRLGVSRYEIPPRLDLCFAYLEIGRYTPAIRHGRQALGAAEAIQDDASIKNALYLLGEAANLSNNKEGAQMYFRRLQRTYFPEAEYLPEFLMAVDIRHLVNLKA